MKNVWNWSKFYLTLLQRQHIVKQFSMNLCELLPFKRVDIQTIGRSTIHFMFH